MFEDSRLRIFLSVARNCSFTLAARELGLTQPAVSHSIAMLEGGIGAKLFTREKGDIRLTDKGLAFKEYAEKILYWQDAAMAMFGTEGKEHSTIRLTADPVIADYLLPKALSIIHAARPEVAFHVESYGCPVEPGMTEESDAEISVAPSPETLDFQGESKLIGVMEAAVVASPLNKSLRNADSVGMKPFSTLAGIHVSNSFAVWQGYERLLTPDISARTSLVSFSIEGIKSMVEASGNLVGVIPEFGVRKELELRTLLKMPVQLLDFVYDIHFNSRPEFSRKQICGLLKETLTGLAHSRP